MERASTSGANMVNSMFNFVNHKTKTADNLRKVVLPISAPISKAQCKMTNAGFGKLDVNLLVPPFFWSEWSVFLPDSKEGWTAVAVRIVSHLGFTGLVQLRDRLFQLFEVGS
jgi:hypothetical protein